MAPSNGWEEESVCSGRDGGRPCIGVDLGPIYSKATLPAMLLDAAPCPPRSAQTSAVARRREPSPFRAVPGRCMQRPSASPGPGRTEEQKINSETKEAAKACHVIADKHIISSGYMRGETANHKQTGEKE